MGWSRSGIELVLPQQKSSPPNVSCRKESKDTPSTQTHHTLYCTLWDLTYRAEGSVGRLGSKHLCKDAQLIVDAVDLDWTRVLIVRIVHTQGMVLSGRWERDGGYEIKQELWRERRVVSAAQ